MLLSFEEPERPVLCAAIAEVELANAAVAAPAIERFREWKTWLQLALQCSMTVLQARVSEALEALSRGREPSPPGERFRRDVLAAIPDIEAMELVERFFAIGRSAPIHGFREGCDRPKSWKSAAVSSIVTRSQRRRGADTLLEERILYYCGDALR